MSLPHVFTCSFLFALNLSLGACSDGGSGDGDGDDGSSGGALGSGGGAAETGGTGGMSTGGGAAETGGTGGISVTGGTGNAGDAVFGRPCVTSDDCPAVDGYSPFCDNSWPGGYCTAGCGALGPCGEAGSVCQVFAAECYKACTEETEAVDCRVAEGYSCVDREGIAGCEN